MSIGSVAGALRRTVVAGIVGAGLALLAAGARAQGPDYATLLLVSQPGAGMARDTFLDLAPHLQGPLRDIHKFDVIVYRPDMPAVRTAVANGVLASADLTDPLTPEAEHKLARALGATLLLTVSTQSHKEGFVCDARLERLIGVNQWATQLGEQVRPQSASRGKRLGLLESIHLLVGSLVQRVADAASRMPALPAAPPTPANADAGHPASPATGANAAANSAANVAAHPAANPGGPAGVSPGKPAVGAPARPMELPSTYALLIERARRNGDTASLMVALRKAINERPHDARLRCDLVQAYNDAGRTDAARDEAMRAVALDPKDDALHRVLGDALLRAGQADGAMKEYEAAVKLDGKDAANLVALGDAYWSQAKPDEALKSYLAAAQADAKSALPHRRLARVYIQQGRYADCTAEVTQAKALLAPGDEAAFDEDHAALLAGVETSLADILARMQAVKKAFVAGTRNREETFKEYANLRAKAEALAGFLDGLPDVGFNRAQALYSQAAALVAQTAEKSQDFLESQDTSDDEQAGLLRIEATKQIGYAAKALKSALTAKQR